MAQHGNTGATLKDAQAAENNNRDWDNSCLSELNDFENFSSSSYSNTVQKSDTSTLQASVDSQQVLKTPITKQALDTALKSALDSSSRNRSTSMTGYQKNGIRTLDATVQKAEGAGAANVNVSQGIVLGDNITHAKLVLYCEPDSQKFQTRTVYLPPNMKCKVGRVFAKSQAAEWNAIFDSKVLSRSHAVIWYSEDNKFWIKDTGSSNGTCINGVRLGIQAAELHYGDVLKFGVDVLEKLRNELHRSIVASVALYLPDGSQAITEEAKVQPMSYRVENVTHHEALERLSVLLQKNQGRCDVFDRLQEVEAAYASSDNECKLLRVQVMTSKNTVDEVNERLLRMEAEFNQYKADARRELLEAKERWEQRETTLLERLQEKDMMCASLTEQLEQLNAGPPTNAAQPSDEEVTQWQKACNDLDAATDATESVDDGDGTVVGQDENICEIIYEDNILDNKLEPSVELNVFTSVKECRKSDTKVPEETKLSPGKEAIPLNWLPNRDSNRHEDSSELLNCICTGCDSLDEHELASSKKETDDFGTQFSHPSSSCTAFSSPCMDFSTKLSEVHKNLQQLEVDMSRTEEQANEEGIEDATDLNLKKNFVLLKQCIAVLQEAYNDFSHKTKSSEADTQDAAAQQDNTLSIVENAEDVAKQTDKDAAYEEQQRTLAELSATIDTLRSEKAKLEEVINENKAYIKRIEAAMAEADAKAQREIETLSSSVSETETGGITFIKITPKPSIDVAHKSVKTVPAEIDLASPTAICNIFDQQINNDLANIRKIVVKREEELEEYRDRLERTEIANAHLRRQVGQLLQIQISNEFSQMVMRRVIPAGLVLIAVFVYFLSTYF